MLLILSMGRLVMKELNELFYAWRNYLRYHFYSKHLRYLRRVVPGRLAVMLFFLFLIVIGVSWFIGKMAYAQEKLSLSEATWLVSLGSFFPWAVSGSFVGVFVHFLRKRFQKFKRALDFLLASAGLLLLSPLFLIAAILIKIDSPGNAFFKQRRFGKNGIPFQIWKFRTMREDAESETGPVWAGEDDPRITRLGRFLRKSHIDELPQLINVFKGEMSLIGPRPERPEFVEEINGSIPHFNQRLKVKPGITGLAQVRYRYGASIKDAARKLEYDLLYIKKMCWMLDFRILFWTVGRVLTGEGAR